MASFFHEAIASHRFQLFATAVLSGATIATLLLGYQALEREERLTELKSSIPSLTDRDHDVKKLEGFGAVSPVDKEDARNQALAQRAQAGDFDQELILEQLARNRVFLKPEGLEKLRNSFVVIVGCGGVGSHCAAALARSGASKLRLIDFDQVTLSSLNRHAVATLADVGLSKVRCLERRLIAITPWARFDLRQEKFDGQVAARLLGPWEDGRQPDFIVDAIDNIDTKVELLKYCHDHKLPVISSMGAGCKSDPTRIIIGDISATTDDGLSRATRRRLKLQGVSTGIPAVFSTERPGDDKAELLPLPEEEFAKGTIDDLGPMARFRVRILPVLGTMPAIFGLTIANHVILSITGYPLDYVPAKGRERMYDGMLNAVKRVEDRLACRFHPELVGLKLPITPSDIGLLADDLYHGRSIITGLSTRLVFIRWVKPEQSTVKFIGEGKDEQKSCIIKMSDLVCMTKEEATRHETAILNEGKCLDELYDAETIARVEERRKEVALYEKYRI